MMQLSPPPAEVILASDGKTVSIAEVEDTIGLIQLATEVQSGPAVARNLGAEHASGAILCFIDSDVIAPTGLVAQIRQVFMDNPEVDALFGSYDDAPFIPTFLSQYRNLLHHYVHQKGREEAFTFWSGCGAIRREAFFKAGGFDGSRFPHPSIEDIELGYRLKRAGYSMRLCKDIQVKHLKKWGAYSMIKTDFLYRALPWTELLLNEKGFTNDLNIKVSDRLSVVAVFLLIPLLFGSLWVSNIGFLSIPVFFAFLILNVDLYQFFYQQKGWWFTLRVIPWHITFYLISGLAFALGTTKYYLKNIRS